MAQQTVITGPGHTVNRKNIACVTHGDSDCPALSVATTEYLTCFTADYVGAQTGAVAITPPSGKLLCIHSVFTSADQNVVDTEFNFATSGICIHKLYVSQQQHSSVTDMHIEGAVDEVLSVTCGAATFIMICYSTR